MRGIDVPHANQYHLGACAGCLGAGAGIVEAVTVALGTHLCQTCAPTFLGRIGADTSETALATTITTHPKRKEKKG